VNELRQFPSRSRLVEKKLDRAGCRPSGGAFARVYPDSCSLPRYAMNMERHIHGHKGSTELSVGDWTAAKGGPPRISTTRIFAGCSPLSAEKSICEGNRAGGVQRSTGLPKGTLAMEG